MTREQWLRLYHYIGDLVESQLKRGYSSIDYLIRLTET